MAPGAIVLGADYRGLGVIQSLGRRGIPVLLLHEAARGVASFSRYVTRAVEWPEGNDEERTAFLLDLGAREQLEGWVLFPTRDDTAALCARQRDVLAAAFRVTTPAWDVVRLAYDKRLTHRLAAEAGVPFPRTWEVGELETDDIRCEFPAIIKPAVKRSQNELIAAKAWRVDDAASLERRLREALALMPADDLLVQELIPGTGDNQLSFAALTLEGRPVATLVARRTRQFPMDFGRASTFVESLDEPRVAELGRRVVEAMRCTGLVEVEFKRDPRTDELKLLDVNARAWGWHTLGRRTGVDFAFLLWRQALGEALPSITGRSGVRWMWPAADMPTAAREILGRRLRLSTYLRGYRRPVDFATLTFDDPLPGLVEVPLQALASLRSRAGRNGRAADLVGATGPGGGAS